MTSTLRFKPVNAKPFIAEVMARSGQNLVLCYQCRRCAGACSVGEETGYMTPDRLIRLIITGDRDQALDNALVWKCVSCYTCGARCPNGIQTGRITETLKKMAKEEHMAPREPTVAYFHDAFVHSALRWGRVNEMEFMALYELRNTVHQLREQKFGALYKEIKAQASLALNMTQLKRMHLTFLYVKGRSEIKRLNKKFRKKS